MCKSSKSTLKYSGFVFFYFAESHEIGCGPQVDANNKLHISHTGSALGQYSSQGPLKMGESVLVIAMGTTGIEQELTSGPKCPTLCRAKFSRYQQSYLKC